MVVEHFLELLAHFRELSTQPLNLMRRGLVSIAVWATTIVATCRIPKLFDDIVGQDHVTKTLINAFKLDRVAQGYMFTGPRGVGKTTTARIVAKALNCLNGIDKLCEENFCENCNIFIGSIGNIT